MPRSLRIGCGAGFWGDDLLAPRRLLEKGQLDYMVMDYLAEITMAILHKHRSKNPQSGFALDFARVMRDCLPLLVQQDVKVVTNAGGLNPQSCAAAITEIAKDISLERPIRIGIVTGDDFMDRLDDLTEVAAFRNLDDGRPYDDIRGRVVVANAYLGAQPIVEALSQGADIVVTGRTTDAALSLGPLMHEFGWSATDYDRLAAGVVAGHLIECTGQVTGGNHQANWEQVPGLEEVGYPIVDVDDDGTIVIGKPSDTGGMVNVQTVTEQLLHEIYGDPRQILSPDVAVDWTSFSLVQIHGNAVKIQGVTGSAPPKDLKVTMSYQDGYKTALMWPYAAPGAVAKAEAALRKMEHRVGVLGLEFDSVRTDIFGTGAIHGPRTPSSVDQEPPEVIARYAARGSKDAIKRLSREQAPMTYGPPGLAGHLVTGVGHMSEVVAHWPTLIPADEIKASVSVVEA